jgi:branched-chain amino acid transport system permease protein
LKTWAAHIALLALVAVAGLVVGDYHQGNLSRIMVLAVYATGYNILFGYTGLLSLGHAMFFAAGLYATGLGIRFLDFGTVPAFLAGLAAGAAMAGLLGALALRAKGVAFMIVTLMFAQAVYLTILYFGEYTRGDEGFVLQPDERLLFGAPLSNPDLRFWVAFALFAAATLITLAIVRRPLGKTLIAIRENEARAQMLGYDTFRLKWTAVVLSGTFSAASGAAYGLLFGYVGASFASVQYSIFPLLWVLLGGAGTVVGPFIGTLFMFYLIDFSSGLTTAYMLIAGVALVLLTLFAPQGIAGEIRRRILKGLP